MRKQIKIYHNLSLILMTVLLAVTGCAVEEPSAPSLVDPTGLVRYVHPTGTFSLSLPPDWVVSDTSDDFALNVSFSPPNSSEPLVTVYIITTAALDRARPSNAPTQEMPNPSSVHTDIDRYVSLYQGLFYSLTDATYKEIERALQPDGSLRVKFVIEAQQGTTQHNDFMQVVGDYFVALRTRIPEKQGQLRTLSRVVNTLDVDTASTWVSDIPDSEENAASRDLVGFVSLNAWVDRNGGFVIVGQVTNNAKTALEFVRINAQLYDTNNQLLLEQDDFVSSDLLKTDEYAPFSLVFNDGLPANTARYELHASARYADFAQETFYGPENFALTSDAEFDENGVLVVSGQVRNEGNLTANLVKVIVTIFDAQQRVVGTDTTLVEQQRLASGEISTFSVRFFELGGEPNTFLVNAQGVITE